jgi:sulfide:quinone oxidoreductase
MNEQGSDRRRVAIVGGGVAGVEALLALHDQAGERASLCLIAREPDFVYKPLQVEEPFGGGPAEQRALEPLVGEVGGEFRLAALESVDSEAGRLLLSDGSSLPYGKAVICVGGRFEPAFEGVDTFPTPRGLRIEEVLTKAHVRAGDSLSFVVPPSATWPLPIYELALMTERRARERNYGELSIRVISPEPTPLASSAPLRVARWRSSSGRAGSNSSEQRVSIRTRGSSWSARAAGPSLPPRSSRFR